MLFACSQIVGLIEIESLDSAGSDCLIFAGREEGSLAEMFCWLAVGAGGSPSSDPADELASSAPAAHRLSGVFGLQADCLLADLERLEGDLADATARFRRHLVAAG